MKNQYENEKNRNIINHHDKHEVLFMIKAEVLKYQNLLTPDMVESLGAIDDFLNLQMGVHEARMIAFKMHKNARASKDLRTTYLYRATGHAVATIHVKEHALRCYDYLMKFNQINGGVSHD